MTPQTEQRVWIVNVAGHDYSAAREYGELRRLTEGYVSRGSTDRMLWTVAQGLKNSSAHDWLLPAGMIPLNVFAVAVWLEMHDTLRLLIHDPKRGDYEPVEIDSSRIADLIDLPPRGDDGGRGDAETPRRGTG